MRLRTARLSDKRGTWLHLLLVAGILLYVYSPFLDHWLDKDVYSRPHTHINIAAPGLAQQSLLPDATDAASHGEHGEHDDGYICLLNIDALLSLLLSIFIAPQTLISVPDTLAAELAHTYFDVTIVYLSSLDPPPTI